MEAKPHVQIVVVTDNIDWAAIVRLRPDDERGQVAVMIFNRSVSKVLTF